MINIELDKENLKNIKYLQEHTYEFNGQIITNSLGKVVEVTKQKGQVMERCTSGCILNYHTHPPDYENLYPDHPSATDMKYIYSATCANRELGSHLIFTPKFVYVIRYACSNWLQKTVNLVALRFKVDNVFEDLADKYDRSTPQFRYQWITQLENLGFIIHIFKYTDTIQFDTPVVSKSYNFIFITIICLVILKFFFSF